LIDLFIDLLKGNATPGPHRFNANVPGPHRAVTVEGNARSAVLWWWWSSYNGRPWRDRTT